MAGTRVFARVKKIKMVNILLIRLRRTIVPQFHLFPVIFVFRCLVIISLLFMAKLFFITKTSASGGKARNVCRRVFVIL